MPPSSDKYAIEDELVPVTTDRDESSLAEANELFLRHGHRFVLYARSKERVVDTKIMARIFENKRDNVYVKKQGVADRLKRLGENLAEILADPRASKGEKLAHLYVATSTAVSEAFSVETTSETVSLLDDFLLITNPFLTSDYREMAALNQLVSYHYDTYTHSTGVYVYAVALAASLGIRDTRLLHDLGLGAILHDLGKTMIRQELLTKPGPLTDDEWLEMKCHPLLGAEMLETVEDVPPLVKTIVVEHHERCDGSGYPEGLSHSSIHPLSQLVVVSDVYDALTKRRSYREAYTPFRALELMKEQTAGRITIDAYRALVLLMARQS